VATIIYRLTTEKEEESSCYLLD